MALMRLEIQNFLRHQCLGFLSIFSVCYLYSEFYICLQVFILLSISFLYSLSLGKYFTWKEEHLDLKYFWKRTRYLSGVCFAIVLGGGKQLCRSIPSRTEFSVQQVSFHFWPLIASEIRWKDFWVSSVELFSNLAGYQKYWGEGGRRNACEGYFFLGHKGNRNRGKWMKWFWSKNCWKSCNQTKRSLLVISPQIGRSLFLLHRVCVGVCGLSAEVTW